MLWPPNLSNAKQLKENGVSHSEYNYMKGCKFQLSFSPSFIAFAWKLETNGNVSSDYL
jgi:hypothetical protein